MNYVYVCMYVYIYNYIYVCVFHNESSSYVAEESPVFCERSRQDLEGIVET